MQNRPRCSMSGGGFRPGRTAAAVAVLLAAVLLVPASIRPAGATVVVLKNGLTLEGRLAKISALGENPLAPSRPAGEVRVSLIVLVDDDLRRTFFSTYQVQEVREGESAAQERIRIPQRVARQGQRVGGVGPILRITPFDEWGRRIFSMNSPRGRIDVVQGITEITPVWTKVEGLLGRQAIVWDMRIDTNSIPRETLSAILLNHTDRTSPQARLQIVRLYIQAERYQDARAELEQAIKDFPELQELERQLTTLRQLSAQRLIQEIELRQKAGQHRLAHRMLSDFPDEGVAGDLLLKVREKLDEYAKVQGEGRRVLELMDQHLAQLADPALRGRVAPLREEIAAEMSIHTLDRFADYLRLADVGTLGAEEKLALAVSGWILGGSGGVTENMAVALSAVEVRRLVREYLRSPRQSDRQALLEQIHKQEAGLPGSLARILAHMKPPLDVPVRELPAAEAPPPADAAQRAASPSGPITLTTPGLTGMADITYHVQLPPEYDPYRRYPTVVTLHGAGSSARHQIDWWAGAHDERMQMRLGQASRRGYIVIAPEWTEPHQKEYQYSAREHAAVLYALRDAVRRFSIDTDRVFLSGHSMGGDAAWDIGLAHPDLWAGVVPLVAVADKYVAHYWENAAHVPLYLVGGELDGDKSSRNARELDRYFKRAAYDVVFVEYLGRGHEHFSDEIQRIFTWMELHERDFFLKDFRVASMRPWDNFFWWVELDDFPSRAMVLPAAWDQASGARAVATTGKNYETNRLVLTTGAGKATVWLAPSMVNFDERVSVNLNGRTFTELVRPDAAVLLEDVRTRGDRQHPFWAKMELDTGRRR